MHTYSSGPKLSILKVLVLRVQVNGYTYLYALSDDEENILLINFSSKFCFIIKKNCVQVEIDTISASC